ncbi:hypothetical protein [Peribacillus butanolivorans]|uniref:hypothetical protein n=1 Tax=Peribacillus butanolivorans TaxID=421767 RepID=UPI0035D81443
MTDQKKKTSYRAKNGEEVELDEGERIVYIDDEVIVTEVGKLNLEGLIKTLLQEKYWHKL